MVTKVMSAEEFERTVLRRTRAILGLRGCKDAASMPICGNALDIAATRGDYSEEAIVTTAKKVADDTQYWI